MTTVTRRPTAASWFAFAVALVAALVGVWLTITLAGAGTLQAGWRHELVVSVLAALAISLATWAEGRPWPQPAALLGAAQVALVAAALVTPFRMEALAAVGTGMLLAAVVSLPAELRASRGAPAPLVAAAFLGLGVLVSITPTVSLLAAAGVLQ